MSTNVTLDAINSQEWLDPIADAVQSGLKATYEAGGPPVRAIKNALHGTWLGHPLHAVITDVPVGAWTTALVLDALEDMTGNRQFGRGADAAVGIGLAGAVVAALSGITDWSDTDGRARKIGLVHGLLNIGGTILYTTSFAYRKKKKRNLGRGFGVLGFAVAFAAAYLGGELVYSEQVGVNHAAGGPPLPRDFVPVAKDEEVLENGMKKANANGIPVLLTRRNGTVYCIAETCSHAGGPLSEGELDGNTVRCPWHGSRFDVRSGRVIDGPATHPEPCFETRVQNGQIEVRNRP